MVPSLSGSIQTRTEILVEIDKNILNINKAFRERPESVDLSTLKALLTQLEQTNAEIEKRKREREKQWIATNYGKWTLRVLLGATLALTIAAAVLGIILAGKTANDKPEQRFAVATTITSSGATISGLAYGYLTRIEDDHEQSEREERFFNRFITAYEDYRNTDDSAEAQSKFRNCHKELSKVPDKELKNLKLPPKPVWVETVAKMQRRRNPEDEYCNQLDSRMEDIAKRCRRRPSAFSGEQSADPALMEPISMSAGTIEREFDQFDQQLGYKLPYIARDGKYYTRDAKIYDTWEEAEAHTTSADHVVIELAKT